jgi:hypothetical protein
VFPSLREEKETRILLGSLEKINFRLALSKGPNRASPSSRLKTEKDPFSETLDLLVIYNSESWTKSTNSVILSKGLCFNLQQSLEYLNIFSTH